MTIATMIQKMSEGLGRTCAIFFLTLLFSLPLGLVIAALRRSRFRPLQTVTRVFISIIRGTPLMLQLLAVTYGPFYLFGASVARNKLVPIIVGFSVNYAAYFAEIYRGGIDSMPAGQYEAAAVLGYSRFQTFMRIILPQVVKRVLLPVANEVITLIKDTALASTVAVVDLMTVAKKQVSSSSSIEPYVVAIVLYLVLNGVAEQLCKLAERKMSYYR